MPSPFKKTIILFGVLVLLFITLLLSNWYNEKKGKEVIKTPEIQSFQKEEAKKIILEKSGTSVILEKQEEVWKVRLDENTSYPAKNDSIESKLHKKHLDIEITQEEHTEKYIARCYIDKGYAGAIEVSLTKI